MSQQISPATQVRWPATTGYGPPAAPAFPCTAACYGQPYVDLTANTIYVCSTSGWVIVTTSSFTPFAQAPSGAVDGVNAVFTLTNAPLAGTLLIVKNGVFQTSSIDYTVAGSTITFTIPPSTGDKIYAQGFY